MNKRAKFLRGANYGEAVEAATAYFGCDDKALTIRTVTEGNENTPWLIYAAIRGEGGLGNNANGSFGIYYEQDGVYFELYPPQGVGQPQDADTVSGYLHRKGIKPQSPLELLALFKKGEGRLKIAPPQEERILGEDIAVSFSPDDLEARLRLLPPEEGGSLLTPEAIREKLTEAGVLFGIAEDIVDKALNERDYKATYIVAAGVPPKPPKDARLEFHFRVERQKGPKETENNRVDYKDLDLFESVEAGQLLVTRYPVVPGTPGTTVKNKEIAPALGKDVPMPKSKNTAVNEDMTEMRSEKSGMVEFDSGRVVVSDVYTVKGDCDLGVGNIDFDGNVKIKGGVISGLVIKAAGHVSIDGVVEGSEIIAGGNVELKRGMQGIDRGRIVAGGSITAQFIERATVISGQDITADVIVHCKIDAGRSLLMNGKRSNLVGGEVRASDQILAKVIGSVSHAAVDIEVGIHPNKRSRIKFLREQIAKTGEDIKKLELLRSYIDRKNENVQQGGKEDVRESLFDKVRTLASEYKELTEELVGLEAELEQAIHGRVHVLDTAYPGVKITIGTGLFRVDDEIKFATFKYSNGKIIFTACEAGGKR